MKRVFLLCFILLNVGASLAHAQSTTPTPPPVPQPTPDRIVGQAKVFYEKDAYETKVVASLLLYDERKNGKIDAMGMGVSFRVYGHKVVAPERVVLEFGTNTYEPKFATPEARHWRLLVDGEEIDSAGLRVVDTVKMPEGNVVEIVFITIDFATTFNQIAKGSKVKIGLGKREFELKDTQVEAFRDILKTIEK
ncbi:MAG TPA: hypothetical protein VGC66_15760 [Pyrinomonadaceae bacterium]